MKRQSTAAFILMGLFVFLIPPASAQSRFIPLKVPTAGRTGFDHVRTSDAGITFSNMLSAAQLAKNRILENGSGVALGDVDGDGLCDIYFCSLEGANKLYRNLGNWKFEDITESAGVACQGQFSTGATFADVDGDGHLDLLVNAIGGGTRLFINDGHGHFSEKLDSGLVRRSGSHSLALADVDGDGYLDLYVANYRTSTFKDRASFDSFKLRNINGKLQVPPEYADQFILAQAPAGYALVEVGEPDSFYLNDKHGGYQHVSWTNGVFLDETGKALTSPLQDWGLSAMFRDINGDGLPDLYVCNDFFSPDRIWINDGKGHFRAIPKLALRESCFASMGVDFADINRDGHDDFMVTEMLSRSHLMRQIQRDSFELDPIPWWGWPWQDLMTIDSRPQVKRNTLFLGRGDNTYAEIAQLSGLQASGWSWSPIFLDVDLDGYEDLLIATGHPHDTTDSDALRMLGPAPGDKPKTMAESPLRFPSLRLPTLAFRNGGDVTFKEVSKEWGFDVVGVATGMALADMDNDGDLDVVINQLNGPPVLLRNESVAPRLAVRLKGAGGNTQGIGARIRVSGGPVEQSQEVMCGGRYLSGDDPVRVFACGSLTNRLRVEVRWRSGKESVIEGVAPNQLCVVDEAGAAAAPPRAVAGQPAVYEEASGLLGGQRHHDEGFDDYERQPLLPRRLSQLGPAVAWVDVDGDGREDLVIGSGRGGRLSVLRNTGQGTFQAVGVPGLEELAQDDMTGIVGWTEEPGQSTLLVGMANYESGKTDTAAVKQHEMFFGNVESAVAVPGEESSVGPLAVGTVNGPGSLELFVGGRVIGGKYPEAASSRMYRRVGRQWQKDEQNSAKLQGVGMVSGAVWTDVEGSGYPALVLACEWGGVKIFRNRGGQLEAWDAPLQWAGKRPQKLSQMTGWWNGVSAGDFDGDGRMDLVLGNWGLNNKYREYLPWGLRVHYGEINGVWQVVESHWEAELDKEVPWRDWKRMREAMPWLSQRFKSYRAYGQASVEEVLGEDYGKMKVLQADVLESVVLLNRGDHFEVRALPMEAQWSPVFGVNVGDYDGDGREDVFLSQNFFGTDLETGRYDAGRGLWLQGDGAGGFRAVPGQESGVKVYGEQRAAALCDYDGDGRVDLVVSQNGGPTKLYHNVGGRAGLRVRVPGGAGIGAVLRLGGSGKWGAAREVHAGSGYWSQDSAVQVMYAGSKDEPDQIQVRWPGGTTTTHTVPPHAQEIQVSPNGDVEKVR